MSFDEDLDIQLARERMYIHVNVTLAGKLRTIRVTAIDALDWASAVDMFPLREDVKLDEVYGYNIRPLSLHIAPDCCQLVEGDELVPLSREQCDKLFKALDGSAVQRLGDAMWNLNQFLPDMAVGALKKALADASAKNSKPRKPSASRAAGSSGGNRGSTSGTSSKTE